jgi:hypothetical protein
MSTLLWTPGAAGPLDEFVKRISRMVERFAADHELSQAQVRMELADGSQHQLATISAEPGFGFFSFTPHAPDGEEPSLVVVPVGAVKMIEISPPDPEYRFGFAASD